MGFLGRWWNTFVVLAIIGLTALCVITVWPSEPKRYLPDFINWPEGRGIKLSLPTIEGGTFGLNTIERREMSLGLDLRGGTRLVLEPEPGRRDEVADLDSALDGARDVIERRVNEFGVAESEVRRLGDDRLDVSLPGITGDEAIDKIGRTALLQLCQPIIDQAGLIAIAREGTVSYKPQTCEPILDEGGDPLVTGGVIEFQTWDPSVRTYSLDDVIWQPAAAELDGRETEVTGEMLQEAFVQRGPLGEPELLFQLDSDGGEIVAAVTEELAVRMYPLAPFLDGEPLRGDDDQIIAPSVQSAIPGGIVRVTGLSVGESRDLAKLLNTGSFPVPLRIAQQQTVDATLGDQAVRNSVIAGEVALLLIMAFMIIYYRVPGLMAALALVVYTSFVLAIFKIWPVTLTLSGVAAFVLSVGMAVDANILIFERMREELRVGRNLIVALEDGFNRAWSSIRDSNVSTLITCGILYWFGNAFGEASIKGFAITLAIGVVVSMFSAITVTRTFMGAVVRIRPLARRLSLFVADRPDELATAAQRAGAVAGGSGTGPGEER